MVASWGCGSHCLRGMVHESSLNPGFQVPSQTDEIRISGALGSTPASKDLWDPVCLQDTQLSHTLGKDCQQSNGWRGTRGYAVIVTGSENSQEIESERVYERVTSEGWMGQEGRGSLQVGVRGLEMVPKHFHFPRLSN